MLKTEHLINLLKIKGYTIASSESFTGGMFAVSVTEIAGASQVFSGSIVAYNNIVKTEIMNISKTIINNFGAVSAKCAKAMALATQKKFKTNLAVSFTGIAGPTACENRPVGLVFISLCINEINITKKLTLSGNRKTISQKAVNIMIDLILAQLT